MSLLLLLSACTGGGDSGKEGDYEATKKMVVDILQTEDGKRAIEELLSEEKMQKRLVIESDVVKDSINELLASEKGADMWKKLFKDPSFVKGFATSIEDEQKKLMKSLMNDAEYQNQMLDLMQNPEITNQTLQLMKSQQFRGHLEKTIQETLDTPLFQERMAEILLQAAEEMDQKEGGKQQGEKEQQQQQQGGAENQEKGNGGQEGGGEGGG